MTDGEDKLVQSSELSGREASCPDNKPPRWRFRRRLLLLGGVAGLVLAAAGAGALRVALDVAAVPSARKYDDLSVSRTVLDRNGDLLRAFTASDERWRLPVDVSAVDPLYIRMLIAFEDRRFRDHGGVDPLALARSLGQMLMAGRIISGGSTLTMQTARLAREADTRSLSGKYQQMVAALAMERDLSKDEILRLYLLRAPFGGNLEGVRAASLVWFGKEPGRLTPAEAALLVALPQAPEARRPDRSPEAARVARDRVLDRAVEAGVLDEEEAEAARGESVPSVRRAMPMIAPHLTRQVVSANPQALEQRLTLDRNLQQSLEALLASKVRGGNSRLSAAALVADHTTGEILAWVGSPGLEEESRQGHVDMVTAVRSPGSALKPFIYGLAFEEGVAHPESYIEDRPVRIGGYTPTNFDMSFQGTVTVREALQLSLNIPAVRLLDAVGPAQLTARMRRAGVEPVLPSGVAPGLAIGLGGVGLSLKDLATLYADLANGGKAMPLRFDMKAAARPSGLPLLEPAAAWYVGDVLLGVPRPDSSGEGEIAFKTGTAYGYRDAVAAGFDGRHVVAVWTGRPDGTPVPGMTGINSAAPILFEAFQRLGAKRIPLPQPPAGVLQSANAGLPLPLREARVRSLDSGGPVASQSGGTQSVQKSAALRIAYPPDGAEVELGLASDRNAALVVKLQGGRGPYAWFANGRPVGTGQFMTSLAWAPDGPGDSVITVVDADGRSDRISVRLH